MGWFGKSAEEKQAEEQQKKLAEEQEKLKENAQLLMQLIGSGIAPGIFGPNAVPQNIVRNQGGTSLIDNLLKQSKSHVVDEYGTAAQDADTQELINTTFNALMAQKRLAGVEVTKEGRAQLREQARLIGSTLPGIAGAMKAMGLPAEQIDSILTSMYGPKGSTQMLYQQAVPSLSRYMSSGRAAQQAGRLTAGLYGGNWNRNATEGVTAQDLGTALNFMSKNGGFSKRDFAHGGFGLSYMGVNAQNAARGGLRGDDLTRALQMSYDQQAVDMAGGIVATEMRINGDAGLLYHAMDPDYKVAFANEDRMDETITKYNKKYGLDININKAGSIEDAKKQVREKFQKALDKAQKSKNTALVKQLEHDINEAQEAIGKFYAPSRKKDKFGKQISIAALAEEREKKEAEAGSRLIQSEVIKMQQEIANIEAERLDAEQETDYSVRADKLQKVRQREAQFKSYQQTNSLTKAAAQVVSDPAALHRAIATSRLGSTIKSALSAEGVQVTQAEALEASKALTGGSLGGLDARQFAKDVSRTIQEVTRTGGSVSDFLRTSQEFHDMAKAAGLSKPAASILNLAAERRASAYRGTRMTDEEVAAQGMKDREELMDTHQSALFSKLRAVETIINEGGSRYEQMVAGVGVKDDTPEKKRARAELVNKLRNGMDLTNEDMDIALGLSDELLNSAYYDKASDTVDDNNIEALINSSQTPSDYMVRQEQRYANNWSFRPAMPRFQVAFSKIAGPLDEETQSNAFNLVMQRAEDIADLANKKFAPGKEDEEKTAYINLGRDLSEVLTNSKHEGVKLMGNKLQDAVNEANKKGGSIDPLRDLIRQLNTTIMDTGLDTDAQTAASKLQGKLIGQNEATWRDRINTKLANLKESEESELVNKATISSVLQAVAESGGGLEGIKKGVLTAFGATDINDLRTKTGELDSGKMQDMLEAIVLDENSGFTAGVYHDAMGNRIRVSDDEIANARRFMSDPSARNMTVDEAKTKNWGTVDGTKLSYFEMGKRAQKVLLAAGNAANMDTMYLSNSLSYDADERENGADVIIAREREIRKDKLKEHKDEIKEEYNRILGSDTDMAALVGTDTGESVKNAAQWLVDNYDDADAKAFLKDYEAANQTRLKEEDEFYVNQQKYLLQEHKRKKAAIKATKHPDTATLRARQVEEDARYAKEVEEFKNSFEVVKDAKGKERHVRMRKVAPPDISKVGKQATDILSKASKEMVTKKDARELKEEDESKLLEIDTVNADIHERAKAQAENTVVKPVNPLEEQFSDTVFEASNYQELSDEEAQYDNLEERYKEWSDEYNKNNTWLNSLNWPYWTGMNKRGEELRKKMDERDAHGAKLRQDFNKLQSAQDELTNALSSGADTDKLYERYEKEIKSRDLDTTGLSKREQLEILQKQYAYETSNYIIGEKGEVSLDRSNTGIRVGTKEGMEWYNELRTRGDANLSKEERNAKRKYEIKLRKWIESHPVEAKKYGFEVKTPPPPPLPPGAARMGGGETEETAVEGTSLTSGVEFRGQNEDLSKYMTPEDKEEGKEIAEVPGAEAIAEKAGIGETPVEKGKEIAEVPGAEAIAEKVGIGESPVKEDKEIAEVPGAEAIAEKVGIGEAPVEKGKEIAEVPGTEPISVPKKEEKELPKKFNVVVEGDVSPKLDEKTLNATAMLPIGSEFVVMDEKGGRYANIGDIIKSRQDAIESYKKHVAMGDPDFYKEFMENDLKQVEDANKILELNGIDSKVSVKAVPEEGIEETDVATAPGAEPIAEELTEDTSTKLTPDIKGFKPTVADSSKVASRLAKYSEFGSKGKIASAPAATKISGEDLIADIPSKEDIKLEALSPLDMTSSSISSELEGTPSEISESTEDVATDELLTVIKEIATDIKNIRLSIQSVL